MANDYPYNTVLVPMQVSVYLNPRSSNQTYYRDPRPDRAYLAPLPKVHGQKSTVAQDEIYQHDIYDDIRIPPYRSYGDIARFQARRSGIYVHWSLPQLYRKAVAAASTGTDVKNQKVAAGIPTTGPAATGDHAADDSATQPTFRPVPDHYIVSRLVTVGDSTGKILIRQEDSARPTGYEEKEWTPAAPGATLNQTFIVLSDQLYRAGQWGVWDDAEARSTIALDYNKPGDLTTNYLGRTYPLNEWPADDAFNQHQTVRPLTIERTANPYFADYVPSNASVFSTLDDLLVPGTRRWYISEASISYTVVGWHGDPSLDPLANLGTKPLAERLAACQLDLSLTDLTTNQKARFGDKNRAANTLVVGQYNSVNWELLAKPSNVYYNPLTFPADDIQRALADAHPVAVGTNIVDALVAYVDTQPSAISKDSDLQALLKRLLTFVLDLNTDNVDSQLEAEDLLSTNNFVRSGQGKTWSFQVPAAADTTNPSTNDPFSQVPSGDLLTLNDLNSAQYNLDAVLRDIKTLQQQLFDQYWIFTVDLPTYKGLSTYEKWRAAIAAKVLSIKSLIASNRTLIRSHTTLITALTSPTKGYRFPLKSGTNDGYYMQADPTVMIAGAGSQYSKDPVKNLPVRLDGSDMLTVAGGMKSSVDALGMYFNIPPNNMPFAGLNLARGITPEPRTPAIARALAEGSFATQAYDPKSKPYYGIEKFIGQNGWYPLYLEYEVEYFNIPYQNWAFQPCGPEGRIGYCIKDGVNLSTQVSIKDFRVLSGRSHILPHASSALKTALNQVFAKINPDELSTILNGDLTQRAKLLDAVSGLDYLSTTLQDLTTQLLTRKTGTHVNPIAFVNGQAKLTPAATASLAPLGLVEQDFYDMAAADGDVMQTTPFAGLTPVPGETSVYNPFKPVMHGQMRFTKLNVVDRWGQVVQAIRLGYDPAVGWRKNALFPAVGEAYSVAPLPTGPPNIANTVMARTDTMNSFVQLPPSINQPARMNADYITAANSNGDIMRPLTEFENPVLGWLLLNYANQSLQIFSPAGEFVREYSVATGAVSNRPFGPSTTTTPAALASNKILTQLLGKFSDKAYLTNLFGVLTKCVASVEASPSHYAESMLSQLGRPIAIVNFGVSMQLQDRPLQNGSTLVPTDPPVKGPDLLNDYTFKYKLGDKDNVFDGLYGYFPSSQKAGSAPVYNFDTLYSYHDDAKPQNQPPYFSIKPFWADPTAKINPWTQAGSNYQCFVGLVDPFSSVHVYTALLPVKLLKLSQASITRGIGRIRSFFKTGPILSPTLIPPFSPANVVSTDVVLGDSANLPKPTGSIQVPTVGLADWLWLQPFKNPAVGATWRTDYNVLSLQDVPISPKKEQAPYQVTEGYLWMQKPFSAARADDVPA